MQVEKKRLFIAVDIADHIRSELTDQVYKKGDFGRVRWVKPENYHLTLKFLGDTTITDIAKISDIMGAVASGSGEVTLTCDRLGLFPHLSKPRVMWVGFTDSGDRLGSIAARLDKELDQSLGIARERRKFSPHLTVARIKGDVNHFKLSGFIKKGVELCNNSFTISSIVLYSSELTRTGAVYTIVKEVSLKQTGVT